LQVADGDGNGDGVVDNANKAVIDCSNVTASQRCVDVMVDGSMTLSMLNFVNFFVELPISNRGQARV
jgi:hypothetical protein